jgi:flagellar biosynthesis protein FlhA
MAAPAESMQRRTMAAFGQNQDLYLAAGVISILLIVFIPLPTVLIDMLLTINISISVVVLLSTIYIQRPTEFSVFPALLLMLTLFRLSLNIATTRMILAEGDGGNVIAAFGSFVTSGNVFVGIVMFSILVIVQFVVITKGATRISEVAARFTLDAMPGKQMGVDSDLNAGLLTEQEARKRRRDIEREADFYGAMDGATKFVRGDAIAGLIITLINVVAGFGVGVYMMDLGASESFFLFTTLTIGDGLVAQVPSLLISIAAGLVVTRTVSDENLGKDLGQQLTQQPRALAATAVLLVLGGLVPGLPTLPFVAVGIFLGILAYFSSRMIVHRLEDTEAEAARQATATEERPPARTEDLLTVDSLKIELGYGLITMADPGQGGDLLTRIQVIRQQIATKMGFIVPVIRIVDNMRLRPNEYQVKLRESVIASYELMPDHFLAMNPGLVEEEIDGYPTQEPAFGLQAVWVPARDRDKAERLGYTIVEPSAVVATHLTELIMGHADELLTREDAQVLVNHLKESAPTVVDELMPKLLSMGELQKVLHNLLRERVSIRNLEMVLEVLCDYAPRTRDTEVLTEYVRHALAREICGAYADEDNVLRVVTLSPELEQEILGAVNNAQTGDYIPVAPDRSDAISSRCATALQPLVVSGQDPVVLTSAPVRRYFKRIVERHIPKVVVLSYNEIDPAVGLESVGQVSA